MRHARYVGPAGKGGSESLYGSAWFGSVWGGIQGGIARVWDFPTEIVLSRTRTHLVPLNYWDRGSKFFCGGAYYGTLGSMAISIETLKKKSL